MELEAAELGATVTLAGKGTANVPAHRSPRKLETKAACPVDEDTVHGFNGARGSTAVQLVAPTAGREHAPCVAAVTSDSQADPPQEITASTCPLPWLYSSPDPAFH